MEARGRGCSWTYTWSSRGCRAAQDKYRSPGSWHSRLVPTNQAEVEDKASASGWCGRMLGRMFTRLPPRIQILDSTRQLDESLYYRYR